MANIFRPEPINKSDLDIWGPKQLYQNRITYGIITCQCYDDSGTLKISKGRIGLIDASAYGAVYIDTITTISLAGVTNGNWFKVEVSRSGTTPTIAATDTNTGVDTDPAILPSELTDTYDPEKSAFYNEASKRLIAVGYKDGSGNLDGIINTLSISESWIGYTDDYKNFFHKDIVQKINKISVYDDYTIPDGENGTEYVFEANSKTATLGAVADNIGVRLRFVNDGTYDSTIACDGAETFIFKNGATPTTITFATKGDFIDVLCDGTNWIVIDGQWAFATGSLASSGVAGAISAGAIPLYNVWVENGVTHLYMWGYGTGDGSAKTGYVTFNLPVTFTTIYAAPSSPNGSKTATNPTTLQDTNGNSSTTSIIVRLASLSSIAVAFSDWNANLVNGTRLMFSTEITGVV